MHKQLAPLSKISNLLPMDAPPIVTRVQGGERKVGDGVLHQEVKVVGNIFSMKISTKPTVSTAAPVTSTVVTTKPIAKGIVISSSGEGGSSSKRTKFVDDFSKQDKWKTIVVEKSKEEKKVEVEAEMEKQRVIQSIMRLRASDPPGMNKGGPSKHYNYETIEVKVASNHMYAFLKKPKQSYIVANSDMNQLDFPVNEMMFIVAQYRIAEKFNSDDEYTYIKLRFHVVLGKLP